MMKKTHSKNDQKNRPQKMTKNDKKSSKNVKKVTIQKTHQKHVSERPFFSY